MKIIVEMTFVAALFSLVSAQDVETTPPATIGEKVLQPAIPGTAPVMASDWVVKPSALPFCPKKTCLYYAGDFDSSRPDAGGLFNANLTDIKAVGQVWVGVKPTKAATVTGVTFNELLGQSGVGTNPTPFQTQIGITPGSAGKIVCNTSGTATEAVYGEGGFGETQYSYTVKKLKKPCKIAKPTKKFPSTYVNLLPTFDDQYLDTTFLVNVQDRKPKNHTGWPNDLNDCYFNGAYFRDNYVTCNSLSQHGPHGFSEFSIALTGTE